MDLQIGPFEASPDNYAALVEIANANWPDLLSATASWQHRDENRDPEFLFRRVVGVTEGRIVAFASFGQNPWSHHPGKYFVSIDVHPRFQRQGIGAALYAHALEALASRDPLLFVAMTREDKPESIRFLEGRGFERQMRYPISWLDVERFDFERFAETERRVAEQGIEILDVPALAAREPEWKRLWYELEWETFRDVPMPSPPSKVSFEEFCKRFDSPGYDPAAHFIALDGDRGVGLTGFWLRPADPQKLHTGLTGVIRSHRRRGIATALKLRAIAWAKRRGMQLIQTDNEENNPMFDINVQLGFTARPAWLDYWRVLRAPRDDESLPAPSRG